MKAIITGMNGTVAPVVARRLRRTGTSVVAWDRAAVAVDDDRAIDRFLNEHRPDLFFHIATGPPEWAERIARRCTAGGIRLVYTGSVSVFGEAQVGPFGVEDMPEPSDDYGAYKLDCEQRVRAACPGAVIARLGWQIGDAPGSNNMLDFFAKSADPDGTLRLSTRWIPACAFLKDTASALVQLASDASAAGVYHLEANPGLGLFAIGTMLSARHENRWNVVAVDQPVRCNLMRDERIEVSRIDMRF